MFQYRVTKYNPAYRDEHGAYTKAEWTAVSDIGKEFDGVVLTEAEYARVEKAYVDSALTFLSEARVPALTICGLENHGEYQMALSEGMELTPKELATPFGEVLREKYWCRFERAGEAFVHFGFDYYMYIGTKVPCRASMRFAARRGLFVEEFVSPYHPEQ